MTDSSVEAAWDHGKNQWRPDVIDATRDLAPGMVRWGGIFTDFYRWREGDANMRSVWLCTRNDALGNLAVLAAALGVFGSGTAWPDLAVATGMALLALTSAWSVTAQARSELRSARRCGLRSANDNGTRIIVPGPLVVRA